MTTTDPRPAPAPTGRPASDTAARLTIRERLAELDLVRAEALAPGGDRAVRAQHDRGKLTARERIEILLDPESFQEVEALRRHRATEFGLKDKKPYTDGVVTGWGTVHGRRVFVYAHDFRIFGGALGEAHAEKIHKVMDLAEAAGAPLIGLCDGAGARIQEGVTALAGYGGIFRRIVRNSGVIPQISVIMGPCAGGAAYAPALTDFVFMVRDTSQMFITGPDVVTAVTGDTMTMDELGGARVHETSSGVATLAYDDERTCLEDVRDFLTFLPSNNRELPPPEPSDDPVDRSNDALLDAVPDSPNQSYDVLRVIEEIVDDGEFFEVHPAWAGNIVCGLARLGGQTVGVVADQPAVLAGALDISASEKAARFVQFCDAFNIPLVTLVDVPGFLPGVEQEHQGIIRHGAKLLYAYCDATVPRIQVILRKAYGGAYIVMDSRSIGADLSYAWPGNEIAVMGAEAAANVVFRKEIAAAPDAEGRRAEKIAEYRRELMHPYYAAERGLVDDIISPADTRRTLIRSLDVLRDKHRDLPSRKHGNQPT
ncbi:methylmalonyl-CoA carboxyltransferase [Nocardiopsis sp. TSRI0078]|uniref:acyl-CoA carboxylase subunit beta n=1 Tax=unclassified Nocardiopsis TaxID=2649073 RepID=UPI00094054C4|nr:acyl-CoA carboxylase subunit beta [Nocardiopsis sp. TSRI0078]OKI22356.1 methylmalonyl-CoA carboxyltransferase [Nocardiopsis sp. TSRI0078]